MNKHTPGPWAYYPDGSAVCVVRAHTLKTVADFGHVDLPEREANARLIAAAPDLLSALVDLLAAFDATVGACRGGCAPSQAQHWRDKARAVIAKARGE